MGVLSRNDTASFSSSSVMTAAAVGADDSDWPVENASTAAADLSAAAAASSALELVDVDCTATRVHSSTPRCVHTVSKYATEFSKVCYCRLQCIDAVGWAAGRASGL